MFKNISSKENISLDNVCYLIHYGESHHDEIGNEIQGQPIKTTCFCAELPAFSSEFFQAGQQGIKVQSVLVVDSESYNEEKIVEYNDKTYSIYRVFPNSNSFTELYLTAKVGVTYGN